MCYVATRYNSKKHKRWQPGFLLSYLAQNFLRDLPGGTFKVWDLGGFNGSPMMSYKGVV